MMDRNSKHAWLREIGYQLDHYRQFAVWGGYAAFRQIRPGVYQRVVFSLNNGVPDFRANGIAGFTDDEIAEDAARIRAHVSVGGG